MCAQPVVYPQRRPIFSTTQLGWLPVPYYTQQSLGIEPDNISKQLCPPSWAIQPSESCSTASPGEFSRLNVEYRKISGIL